MVFVFVFLISFSHGQNNQLLESDKVKDFEVNSEEFNPSIEKTQTPIFITQGATLINSKELNNVEIIVVIPKPKNKTTSLVKKESKKSKRSIILPEKEEKKVSLVKPRVKIHFHSLPSSESLLANHLLKTEIVRVYNSYVFKENNEPISPQIFKNSTLKSCTYQAHLNLSAYLDSILARPPPIS